MIRQINTLIPYGTGKPHKISTLLIGNIGEGDTGGYNYLVLYDEPKSAYSDEIHRFKLIKDYDRNQPLLSLLEGVYKKDGWFEKDQIEKAHPTLLRLVGMLEVRLDESKKVN